MRRVKVLVVDDSIMFRKMLSEFLDEDPEIEVVAWREIHIRQEI